MANQNFRVKTGLEVGTGITISSSGNITAGVITATSFVGSGSQLAGVIATSSAYATSSGISTFADVAGIATVAQNLTGYPSITVTNLTALGNVSIAGTLTYEDVTNVDSIGVITARSSVTVGAGLSVVGVTTLASAGGITTTGGDLYVGDDLEVGGDINFNGFFYQNGVEFVASRWSVGSGTTIYRLSDVGIGTTNPTEKLSVVGVVSATSFYGDASNTVSGRWTLGADGTNNYTFIGIGFTATTNDPTLYLKKGEIYEFVNNSGGSHPFQIRISNGGSAYSNGVTNNGAASGIIKFEVPFNAPNSLYYQCINHSSMGGTIFIEDSFDTRVQTVSEKLTRVDGNIVSLVYNSDSSNIGFATNPTGDITLQVTGIPTTSDFDNRVITFSVFVNQTGVARSCTAVTLNGVSKTIKWAGGSLSDATIGVTTTSGYDIYSFTGINTVGSASTGANYDVLGVVNGGYR